MSKWKRKNKDVGPHYNRNLFGVRVAFFCLAALGVAAFVTLGKPMKDLDQDNSLMGGTPKVHLNPAMSDSIASSAEIPTRVVLDEGLALILKSDCNNCHKDVLAVGGPAYADIAARHKGDHEALEKIMEAIRLGGSGYWGAIPMPAHPDLKNEEIEKMAKYILTLKGGNAPRKTPLAEVK